MIKFVISEYWKQHPDVAEIVWIQAKEKTQTTTATEELSYSSEEDENARETAENEDSASYDEEEADNADDDEENDTNFQPKNKFALLSSED